MTNSDDISFVGTVYNYDWSSTLLGSMESWDPTIKTATRFQQFRNRNIHTNKNKKKYIFRNDDYYEMYRDGYTEETYFECTYSPVFKLDGTVWAIFMIAQETTQKVFNSRRLKILSEFGRLMPG
ncbi:hypothetical protein C2G38_2302343 [Gigaspora rosea]|uniref:PAC domain-containing protein n=1 Tax=Gigaspora rosea TaxID=44941 RepID=A0A397VEF8_9GLOM|nr:hypothetical protein C2G38_2302343 [Gigaspora rosea]